MFRRNKNKGAKSKFEDDTVALTGPDVLSSSSSGAEPTNKGGRFIGRRKKKIGTGKGKSTTNLGSAGASRTAANMEFDLVKKPPTQPQYTPESAPQAAMKKRPPSKNAINTNMVTVEKKNNNDPPRQFQQRQSQRQPPANVLEMRDEWNNSNIQRQSSSMKDPPLLPLPSSDASKASSSNVMSGISSTVSQSVAASSPAGVSKPPSMVMNGGNQVHQANPVPMMRSGWSVQSNASSAMNSEHYIQSLDNLPTVRSGKSFPMLSAQPDDRIRAALSDDRIRAALSRQFGRNYPPQTFRQKWFVKVGQPKWDNNEGRHKYKIDITMNPSTTSNDDARSAGTESYSHLSFASTSASRSLQDFVWLEQALRAEYHGALIVPLLSLALYFGSLYENLPTGEDESLASKSFVTDATRLTMDSILGENNGGGNAVTQSFKFLDDRLERNEIVDANILANWLSDIINGMRGNGEVLLYSCVDVVESEAMETFLYRHTETLDDFGPSQMGAYQRISSLGSPFNLFSGKEGCHNKSIFENLLDNPFQCFGMDPVCGGDKKRKAQDGNRRMPLSMMCSSGATGIPGIENCNSYLSGSEVEAEVAWLQSSRGIATHSELLEAERDLIASYLKSSSLAMLKVQSLIKDEAYVGQCWKRFAVSLSNLFSVEKDLEQAHIGDQIKSNKKNQPFRKLRKSSVDDALRVLARGKIDRSNPSLQTLRTMLIAYYADLNSVVPAFREYSEAINQLHQLDEVHSIRSNRRKNSSINQHTGNNEWQSSIEQLKAMTWGVTNKLTSGGGTVMTNDSDPTADDELSTVGSLSTAQTRALQTRVLSNEKMLKFSITSLCRSSPLRNARMASWYLKTEAKQAMGVHNAATTLRQKLSIDADAAIAMKERRYDEDEKRDNDAELELVKRILDLGSLDDDRFDQEARHQNAIRIATEQVGRWNAKTALALMEAAGVEDAEVQIDETSRELRHVRKYAISLRENVARCLESSEELASIFILNSDGSVQINRSRREFWAAISAVFSGKILSDETGGPNGSYIGTPSIRVLSSAGLDVSDRGGWLGHNTSPNQPNQQRRNCGEAARQYLKKRDNQANILISRIIKLLKDYERRLEGIESFVYMHCVGIQLEKHCSRARSKALSAWEKRTDISTAINVATKKKIPKLVSELRIKLDSLPQVSHTTVLNRKEEHLTSKNLKSDLHKLANRRFGRAQEVSTERVIAVMSLWAKHEESVAMEEVKALGEAVQEVELSIQGADVDAALDGYSLIHGDSDSSGRAFMM